MYSGDTKNKSQQRFKTDIKNQKNTIRSEFFSNNVHFFPMLIKPFSKIIVQYAKKKNLKILKSKDHIGHIYEQNVIKLKISIIIKRRNL